MHRSKPGSTVLPPALYTKEKSLVQYQYICLVLSQVDLSLWRVYVGDKMEKVMVMMIWIILMIMIQVTMCP